MYINSICNTNNILNNIPAKARNSIVTNKIASFININRDKRFELKAKDVLSLFKLGFKNPKKQNFKNLTILQA